MSVLFQTKKFWAIISRPLRRTYTANICGHQTKLKGPMSDGESVNIMEMPLAENGSPDYCLECIGKMSIKCAWCEHPIVIGELITLYVPQKDFTVPDYAVHYPDDTGQALVGCSRMDCADGCDICGRWMPPGKVARIPSPLELCLTSGGTVIVDDMSKYPESATIHRIS